MPDLNNAPNATDAAQSGAVIVVLNRPQDVVNVGAVVRAMKNMGFSHLRLVDPAPLAIEDILRIAHRCEDIVAAMTIHDSLDDALADSRYVIGTAAIAHHKRPLTTDIRGLADDVMVRTQQGNVALLFGQEDDGLDNYALDRCHCIAMLPSNPAYPALNLAQSVLLFLYEMRMASGKVQALPVSTAPLPASQADLERIFLWSEALLTNIGFFRYNPDSVMRTLRQLTYRMAPSVEESKLLMAILHKLMRIS